MNHYGVSNKPPKNLFFGSYKRNFGMKKNKNYEAKNKIIEIYIKQINESLRRFKQTT